jgi:hypothetical protein
MAGLADEHRDDVLGRTGRGEMASGLRRNVGKHMVTERSLAGHRSIAGVELLRQYGEGQRRQNKIEE